MGKLPEGLQAGGDRLEGSAAFKKAGIAGLSGGIRAKFCGGSTPHPKRAGLEPESLRRKVDRLEQAEPGRWVGCAGMAQHGAAAVNPNH